MLLLGCLFKDLGQRTFGSKGLLGPLSSLDALESRRPKSLVDFFVLPTERACLGSFGQTEIKIPFIVKGESFNQRSEEDTGTLQKRYDSFNSSPLFWTEPPLKDSIVRGFS